MKENSNYTLSNSILNNWKPKQQQQQQNMKLEMRFCMNRTGVIQYLRGETHNVNFPKFWAQKWLTLTILKFFHRVLQQFKG